MPFLGLEVVPPRAEPLGERMSGLEATVAAFEKYERDRWHKLSNDLQPLVNLPERLTRDIAKMQGVFDGRISTVSKDIERSITAAVERAIEPVNADVAKLKTDVEALQSAHLKDEGARGIIAIIFRSPVIAWLASAGIAVWALLSGRVQP